MKNYKINFCTDDGQRMSEELYKDLVEFVGEDNITTVRSEERNGETYIWGIVCETSDQDWMLYIMTNLAKELRRDCMIFANPEPYDMEIGIYESKYEEIAD